MAYILNAIVGDPNAVQAVVSTHARAHTIRLSDSLLLIPITEEFFSQVDSGSTPRSDKDGMFEYLSPRMENLLQSTSIHGTIAYVSAEFWGGDGKQCSIVYRDGKAILGPTIDGHAINTALVALRVVRAPGRDEFDIVGLGRYRGTEEWLSEPTTNEP